MSSSLIPIFIWLIIYLFRLNDKKESDSKPVIQEPYNQAPGIIDATFKGGIPQKEINYFSNNRLVKEPHIFYYFNMLRLQDCKEITDETIDDATFKRYALINKVAYNKNWPIASRDVYAAKAYLMDRWAYMTHLN